MTETFNTTRNHKVDHTKFGGLIYPSDFNTTGQDKKYVYGSNIASRILADQKFDLLCKSNVINRDIMNGGNKNA